jgi:hypothetical protein
MSARVRGLRPAEQTAGRAEHRLDPRTQVHDHLAIATRRPAAGVDAVTKGFSMLESWETGMTRDAPASPDADVRQVEAVLTRLHERVGAERMWEGMREPNQALYGVTPPRTLVGHGLRWVAPLIDAIPPTDATDTQT